MSVHNNFTFIEDDSIICTTNAVIEINVKNYRDLIKSLNKSKYDHSNTLNGYITSKDINEEVIVHKDNIELASDSTIINYDDFTFVIIDYCNNNAVIDVKDEGSFCEDCYNKTNHPPLEIIKNTLENPIKYLSVSKKIIYILNKYKEKIESKDIYEKGKPWNIIGSTQINTIQARCSSLYKSGIIKKEFDKYYI